MHEKHVKDLPIDLSLAQWTYHRSWWRH